MLVKFTILLCANNTTTIYKMQKLILCLFLMTQITLYAQKTQDSIPKKWKITGRLTFLFNQSSFTNWKSGGDNTIAANIGINYDFNYKKNHWNWDNRIITDYGLSYTNDKGYRKTNDRFEYNSLLGYNTQKYWFLSFYLNFKTQYTRGYDYKKEKHKKIPVSDFFAPAYLSYGPGMLWKKSDNAKINIAPATTRFTFVSDEFSGKYGVDSGENVKFSLGFNLSAYFKFDVMENIVMENILSLYSDYLNKPQNIDVDYQTNFNIKVNKLITMSLKLHTIIDDNASSKIQFSEIFGFGIKYIFQQKEI